MKLIALLHTQSDGSLAKAALETVSAAKQLGVPFAIGILGNYTGTQLVKAGGAVSVGANVSPIGTAVTSGLTIGVALDAAETAGDLIEVAHCLPFTLPA